MGSYTLKPYGILINLKKETSQATFDYVGRYRIIGSILSDYFNNKDYTILDVGGLGSLLPELLNKNVTILDEDNAAVSDEEYVTGDGARMPYAGDSFDAVVTADTLEHIKPGDRKQFVKEVIRVSSDIVIICAPFNTPGVQEAEISVNDHYRKMIGHDHRWLAEHIDYGLPDTNELEKILKDSGYSYIRFGQSDITIWKTFTLLNMFAYDLNDQALRDTVVKMNEEYANGYAAIDISPQKSYRQFYILSKKRKIAYTPPPTKAAVLDEFSKPLELMWLLLNPSESFVVHTDPYKKLLEEIKSLQEKKNNLEKECDGIRNELESIKNSKRWKLLSNAHKIKQRLTRPKNTQ